MGNGGGMGGGGGTGGCGQGHFISEKLLTPQEVRELGQTLLLGSLARTQSQAIQYLLPLGRAAIKKRWKDLATHGSSPSSSLGREISKLGQVVGS